MTPEARQFVAFPAPYSHDKIKEILVFTVLEKTLCDAETYHSVVMELEKRYGCTLLDCCKNPQYLIEVLRKTHPENYGDVVRTINRNLEMFSDEATIARFLDAINC